MSRILRAPKSHLKYNYNSVTILTTKKKKQCYGTKKGEPAAILTRLYEDYNCLANLMFHREAEEISYGVVYVVTGVIMLVCVNLVPMEVSIPK